MECILTGQVKESVYKTAQENGYTGSEAEFYEDLVSLKDGPFLPLTGGTLGEGNLISWGSGTHMAASNNDGLLFNIQAKQINVDDSIIRRLGEPEQGGDAATKDYVDRKVTKPPKATKATLSVAGWEREPTAGGMVYNQTITIQGIVTDESKQLIMPMPAMASQYAYSAAGIICDRQIENAVVFTTKTVPSEAIDVYIVVQEVIK